MPSAEQRTTDIVAGPGGVMTDEVGVVTGELTLRSELADGKYVLRVQYTGADEWYTVTGTQVPLPEMRGLNAMHAQAVALLNRPDG
jgi:hypothetical protein